MVKVSVKWDGKKFDLDIDPESPIELVKAQLFDLSGVPVDRQKIICKGKQLKADSDLKKLKKNQRLMMFGTASELPKAPTKKILFKEDLPEVLHDDAVPSGLQNLGNTCYMNSVLQCLRGIPEFKEGVKRYSKRNPPSGFETITVPQAMGKLYDVLDSTTEPVPPFVFWNTLKRVYPMFAETTPQGVPKQQDADECYQNLMQYCRESIKTEESKESEGNIVDDLFSGEMVQTLKCLDKEDEPEQSKVSKFTKLRCHISDNKITHSHSGILDSLEQTIEKKPAGSDANMNWLQKDRISKLPKYLTVQFVRFFWKAKEQKKAKINRKIVFPVDQKFDVYEFCAPKLREQIGTLRQKRLDAQDAAREKAQSGTSDEVEKKESSEANTSESDAMQVEASPAEAGGDAEDTSSPMDTSDSTPSDQGQESGYYELVALVTHKGLSADSGHYMGWVQQNKDDWCRFDDDKVTQCGAEDIKKLYGGGQWDTAYIAFFKKVEDFK